MQASATDQKNKSGEGQDLRLYERAAEVAYQYAKNKAAKEEQTSSKDKNELMEQDNDQ